MLSTCPDTKFKVGNKFIQKEKIIDDLKLGLNTYHPVIKSQLEPKEIFQQLKELIEGSGVGEDKRFTLKTETSDDEMTVVCSRAIPGSS